MGGAPAMAQEKAAAKKAPPPTASVTTNQQAKSAWVKLCEKAPFNRKGKDGKDIKEEKNICLTHHERLDGNTGAVLVSAAIREVDGSDKKSLMIMVPLGMAIPPGIRAAVYTKDQWAKVAKNEKIDEKSLKPVLLKYSLCHAAGCTAETIATKEILDQMNAGGGIMVIAMNAAARPVGFPVPLAGFTEAHDGKPVDNKEYAKARGQLMAQIRKRQIEAMEKAKAEKMKLLPPQPGTGLTVKSAPAKKK
jgi:invasion protein IalB